MIPEPIPVRALLADLGHVATRGQLRQHLTGREIADAVAAEHIVRLARGRYGLRSAHAAERAAMTLTGSASHPSAAELHGWPIVRLPPVPWETVPRNRKVPASIRAEVVVVHGAVEGLVTPPLRTVLDCAKRIPFAEALAVADSALRAGDVDRTELVTAAGDLRGPGSARCRRVAHAASALAGSCFESCLRAIALDVALDVVPQHPIALEERVIHPDLVDVGRRLVLEADSYAHHRQDPRVFQQDLWRYTSLTVAGWTVLRFGYQHVVSQADWVARCLRTFL